MDCAPVCTHLCGPGKTEAFTTSFSYMDSFCHTLCELILQLFI